MLKFEALISNSRSRTRQIKVDVGIPTEVVGRPFETFSCQLHITKMHSMPAVEGVSPLDSLGNAVQAANMIVRAMIKKDESVAWKVL
jgi:hypothetical protein